jgi:hypothetical protein
MELESEIDTGTGSDSAGQHGAAEDIKFIETFLFLQAPNMKELPTVQICFPQEEEVWASHSH